MPRRMAMSTRLLFATQNGNAATATKIPTNKKTQDRDFKIFANVVLSLAAPQCDEYTTALKLVLYGRCVVKALFGAQGWVLGQH